MIGGFTLDVAARAIEAYGGRTLGRPVSIGALSRTLIARGEKVRTLSLPNSPCCPRR